MSTDPKSAKIQSSHWCLFCAYIGSLFAKAACKTLVQRTPDCNISLPRSVLKIIFAKAGLLYSQKIGKISTLLHAHEG